MCKSFSITSILLFYDSGVLSASKWLKQLKRNAKKVAARYHPQQQSWVGIITPQRSQKLASMKYGPTMTAIVLKMTEI